MIFLYTYVNICIQTSCHIQTRSACTASSYHLDPYKNNDHKKLRSKPCPKSSQHIRRLAVERL